MNQVTDDLKILVDVAIGFGTFRAGVSLSTVLAALERHNKIYRELLMITPVEVTNGIVDKLNADTDSAEITDGVIADMSIDDISARATAFGKRCLKASRNSELD